MGTLGLLTLLAAVVLAAAAVLFAILLRLTSGSHAVDVRLSILPGLVRGMRAWRRLRSPQETRTVSAGGPGTGVEGELTPAGEPFEETTPTPEAGLELRPLQGRVHRATDAGGRPARGGPSR